uniref:G_PROTEIN_RECEP_F1_2 domain-containing protein n=1 Tax=Parastrongyloides trichosuri TaxID=131310 RepID=A0A0N5A6I6_PARTI
MVNYTDTFIHKLRIVSWYTDLIAEISGLGLNLFLIGIVMTISNKEFKNYRRILLTTSIFDIIFSIFTFPCGMSMEPANKYFITWTHGSLRNFSLEVRLAVVITIIGTFYITILNTAIVFYYRYLLITQETIMSKWRYFRLMLFNVIWNAIGAIIWGYALISPPSSGKKEAMETLGEEFFYNFDGTVTEFFILQPVSIAGMCALVHNTITCTFVVLVVIKTYKGIQDTLKKSSSKMTSKSKNLQKQLNMTMILQALTPLILCVVPVLTMVFCCFLKVLLYGISSTFFITFMYVPALNAIICLVCVKVCRKKMCNLFMKKSSQTTVSSVAGKG